MSTPPSPRRSRHFSNEAIDKGRFPDHIRSDGTGVYLERDAEGKLIGHTTVPGVAAPYKVQPTHPRSDAELGYEILLAAANQDHAALENFTLAELEAACLKARELLTPKLLPTVARAESVGYMALNQASHGLKALPLGGSLNDAIMHMGMGQKIYLARVTITLVDHSLE